MPEIEKPFNLQEWETDPKHQQSRDAFDQMVLSAQKRAEEARRKKEEEERAKQPKKLFGFLPFDIS